MKRYTVIEIFGSRKHYVSVVGKDLTLSQANKLADKIGGDVIRQ